MPRFIIKDNLIKDTRLHSDSIYTETFGSVKTLTKHINLVDGHWSPFGEWSGCTAECGGGSRMRIRACDRPAPVFGGADCKGESSLTIACNTQQCPGK